ncbi:MAG: glycosyltransferase family 4 protein [Deltaproteobacteria bacterium]|nr:glycosyltransferase family 4 protein [Deltaproteobacteria bacterium]
MRILFVSNYFPPEVNAPARRVFEHAIQWVRAGHEVEVLTSAPNFPEGAVYQGYRNLYRRELVEGIRVTRVPMFISANRGKVRRSLAYGSFLASGLAHAPLLQTSPDVVVATSPQILAAVLGLGIAKAMRLPFVLEIRDIWPESIVAVGASGRNQLIRALEGLERFLYENSDHIVVVTHSFKDHVKGKGISAERITVLMNGADLSAFGEPPDPLRVESMRRELGLEGKFVASYIGTLGMAHRAEIMLEAARICPDPNVVFMVVGTGAERPKLERLSREANLANFRLVDKHPADAVPALLALTDVSVVMLRDTPLFRTVVPSKIFEAMATHTPIVLGVEGETRALVERAGCGIPIPPESPAALVDAVCRLCADEELYDRLARQGGDYVRSNHDRKVLAERYLSLLAGVRRSKDV